MRLPFFVLWIGMVSWGKVVQASHGNQPPSPIMSLLEFVLIYLPLVLILLSLFFMMLVQKDKTKQEYRTFALLSSLGAIVSIVVLNSGVLLNSVVFSSNSENMLAFYHQFSSLLLGLSLISIILLIIAWYVRSKHIAAEYHLILDLGVILCLFIASLTVIVSEDARSSLFDLQSDTQGHFLQLDLNEK